MELPEHKRYNRPLSEPVLKFPESFNANVRK
jgi:hypothetical protein